MYAISEQLMFMIYIANLSSVACSTLHTYVSHNLFFLCAQQLAEKKGMASDQCHEKEKEIRK